MAYQHGSQSGANALRCKLLHFRGNFGFDLTGDCVSIEEAWGCHL